MAINLDNLFAYMDLRDRGFSEEEISKAYLDPMQAEAEARFKEEASMLAELLRTRLETRIKEDHGSLDLVEGIEDNTALAREEIQKRQASLLVLEEKRKALEDVLAEHKQELATAHGRHEHLTGTFRGLQMQLKITPADPRWINRAQLAKLGAEMCNRNAHPEGSPGTDKSLLLSKLAIRTELEAERGESEKALTKYLERREIINKVVSQTIDYLTTAQKSDTVFEGMRK